MPTFRSLINYPIPWFLWFSTDRHRHYAISYMLEYNPELDLDLVDSLEFSVRLRPASSCTHEIIISGKDSSRIFDAVPNCFSDQPSSQTDGHRQRTDSHRVQTQ